MSGPLWQGPGQHTDTLPLLLPRRNGSHAADPLDDLAERFEEVIAGAVHPDEIAAVLESDGMTDDHIRLTYGRPDSFAIAEELYDRVPRSFPNHLGKRPACGTRACSAVCCADWSSRCPASRTSWAHRC